MSRRENTSHFQLEIIALFIKIISLLKYFLFEIQEENL